MQLQKNPYLEEIFNKSQSIAILIAESGNDYAAAGVSLSLFIKEKYNKDAMVVYKGDLNALDKQLSEIHEILSDFESRALKVSINYGGSGIETVDHYKEGNENLILEIKPIKADFDMKRIKFDIVGGTHDTIITLGVKTLDQLKEIYGDKNLNTDMVKIINIDISTGNQNFGKINLVENNIESISGLIMKYYSEWGYVPSKQSAKALLLGLS
jgi:hypothetical protein